MSFVYEKPRRSVGDSFAGGEAGLGAIFGAALDQQRYVENLNAENEAMDLAIDLRNEEVRQATGTRPAHPFRSGRIASRAEKFADWEREVSTIAGRIPDGSVAARLTRRLDVELIARAADERANRLSGSRDGLGAIVAGVGGAAVGALKDPLTFATLLVGGGLGAGRTVAARILTAAAREAALNGAITAAAQPVVQDWRRRAGLEAGVDQALRNTAFAALLGGAFGAAGQGASEGVARLTGRALDVAGDVAASDQRIAPDLRKALSGDTAAARSILPEIREALPPAARGALDHGEILDHVDATRPAALDIEGHETAIGRAHRILEDPEAGIRFDVDPARVERITREITGEVTPAPAETRQSLAQFLAARGGLLDDAGELKAIGAERLAQKPRGRGARDRRESLDSAREAAEQAGYLGRDGEVQTTSVADLLDALDQEMRGTPVFSRFEAQPERAGPNERDLAGVAAAVHDVARLAGPGVDDALIRRAAEMTIAERIGPDDALERVLMSTEDGPAPAARSGDPLPGWSDEELEAAASRRPLAAEPAGIDDPGLVDEAFDLTPDELEAFGDMTVPGLDGQPVRLETWRAQVARLDDAAFALENCRL